MPSFDVQAALFRAPRCNGSISQTICPTYCLTLSRTAANCTAKMRQNGGLITLPGFLELPDPSDKSKLNKKSYL